MSVTLIVFLVLVVLWLALQFKTERADGVLIRKVHPYRKMMPYIMQSRNESVVYYDTWARADAVLAWVKEAREHRHVDLTHCVVAAAMIGLAENPRMNQFISGRRLYRRKIREVTFSMKRKKMDRKAKLAVVKTEMHAGETFPELCERIQSTIGEERTDKQTYMDKELALFDLLPRPLMNYGVRLFRWLDYNNILPYSFIKNDGMYTSMFIANLGSVGMSAGFHHLYEWGNCPLFMMVGRIEERPVVRDGAVVSERMLHIRWSYDERIDDGLTSSYGIASVNRVLEDPQTYFGSPDGSGAPPLDATAAQDD